MALAWLVSCDAGSALHARCLPTDAILAVLFEMGAVLRVLVVRKILDTHFPCTCHMISDVTMYLWVTRLMSYLDVTDSDRL